MRKLFLVLIAGVAALSASAQVNYKIQTACNPQDVKTYDTERLRSSFLMEKVMVPTVRTSVRNGTESGNRAANRARS